MGIRFEVSLSKSSEINFKELIEKTETENEKDLNFVDLTKEETKNEKIHLKGKYNIIEQLEQRYGKGGFLDIKKKKILKKKNIDFDDLYDSEDSFIDDKELHESIENIFYSNHIETKYNGFFVNAGEKIEIIKKNNLNEINKSPKKKNIKKYDEIEDIWEPSIQLEFIMNQFKKKTNEYFNLNPMTKIWPSELDDHLRLVDKYVVSTHPHGWRLNGYMVYLMTFLPFTKSTLRNRMIMLEAKEYAEEAKKLVEKHIHSYQFQMEVYATKFEKGEINIENAKEIFSNDQELATTIYTIMTAVDDWVHKENEFRPLLKQEDKKQLEPADTLVLSIQRERNRIFSKLYTMIPVVLHGKIELNTLREHFKSGKKGNIQTEQKKNIKKLNKTTNENELKQIKKPIKSFRSRRFDTCPIWSSNDFIDLLK